MLVTRKEIIHYIPQRDPMVMVHDIVDANEEVATTQFEILPDNIFVSDGLLHEPGLVENIAQSAAAQMGYAYQSKGMPVPIGYIASIKDLTIHSLPPVGAILTTHTRVTNQVMEVTLVQGLIKLNGTPICSCEMRIFVGKQS
jgi:3-hydroxyacyl-[acyl-carrier-protein] dehydratase